MAGIYYSYSTILPKGLPAIRLECQLVKQKFFVSKYLYQTSNIGTQSSKAEHLSSRTAESQEILSTLLLFQERIRQILIDHSIEVALTLQNNIFKITGYFIMFEGKNILEIRTLIESSGVEVN